MDPITTDDEGFLSDFASWTADYAHAAASQEHLTLTDDHLEVVAAAREFYRRTGKSPSMRPLVNAVRRTCGPDLGSSLKISALFPDQTSKLVALISGLPKPSDCL